MARVARLLEQIIPQHYRLTYDIDMEGFQFQASEEVVFELPAPARTLTFHARELNIISVELETGHRAKHITVHEEDQTVAFIFAEMVPAGAHRLTIVLDGAIADTLHGFYRSSYQYEGQERWIAATQFEAVHAREAFVCIDEPRAKAIFEFSLIVPEQLTVLSNTNVVSETSLPNGRKQVDFAPTPKMSSYLAAWVIGDLEYLEGKTPEGVTVRAYSTPGKADQLAFAVDTAVKTLSFYSGFFGIPYPLPKLDMVAVPDFASGAMENWGMVTYRETALLLDPEKSSLTSKQWVGRVVTHELAHQWFGNLVTMGWWEDIWLNEGFASWVETVALHELFPEWEVWTDFMSSDFAYSMDLDALVNTHAIQVEVDDPRHLDEIFDTVSYYKGSSIINMLHHYLTPKQFRAGLQDYLKKHSYGNTTTHDLWTSLAHASGRPVDELMSAWTSQPGFPLVSFEDGRVSQRRFYSSPREAAKAERQPQVLWPIPFSVLLDNGEETKPDLLSVESMPEPSALPASKWFKPNPGQTAYYRTHYTQTMIEALTKPLHDQVLPATDRFGVVNDVFATTQAGITDSAAALKLVQALQDETNLVVWEAVSGGFGTIRALVDDELLYDKLGEFGHWLVQHNVDRLGWEAKPDEPAFDTLMRPLVLQQAVRFYDETITSEALRRYEIFLDGGTIDPDLRPVILYAAARDGGETEFEAILKRYRSEESPQAKISFLAALGRFRRPVMVERFLELGLSADVRPQDLYMVLAHGFRNRHARHQTWRWLKANWPTLVDRYGGGGHMLEHFPLYAGGGFATHEMAREIRQFFTDNPHPSITRPVAQAVEGVEQRADWYDRDHAKIKAFLEDWLAK